MRSFATTLLMSAGLLAAPAFLVQGDPASCARPSDPYSRVSAADIRKAFGKQGIRLSEAEAAGVRSNVLLALGETQRHGLGNSKVDFAAVEMARDLGLDAGPGSATVKNIVSAIGFLMKTHGGCCPRPVPHPLPCPVPELGWDQYFQETTNLVNQPSFMTLMNRHQFHPVKISWEDIGRHEGSVWGDRISDVGIWVRKNERDSGSAKLALSVRRDGNFRDKVLMVPSENIKIHVKEGRRLVEKTLPQRLQELGLASKHRDRNAIVSNQFAIVPVPARHMRGVWPEGVPPRAAFNFSIQPYGSTNFVITDVIEGSHEAVVGPGSHQMLFANVDGQKAPFTASRAADRPDLLRLEKTLKAKGMDVDVQRYYLIQIPLQRNRSIQQSNMGTPPFLCGAMGGATYAAAPCVLESNMPAPAPYKSMKMEDGQVQKSQAKAGLDRVAIGQGDAEGAYFTGAGYRGQRAEEPIRVTVVYFVTPVGKVTEKDMEAFANAFKAWDSQAIWGGSFVTKEN